MRQQRQQNNESAQSIGAKPIVSRMGPMNRLLIAFVVLFASTFALIKFCLPTLVERVICSKMESLGLNDARLSVQKVGLSSATIELVSVSDKSWSLSANRVLVNYAPFDLIDGKLEEILIEGMEVVLKLPDIDRAGSNYELCWLHDIPAVLENLGLLRAHRVTLNLERGAYSMARVIDVEVASHSGKEALAVVSATDFKLQLDLQNTDTHTELSFGIDDVEPDTLIPLLNEVLKPDQPLLPAGLSVSGARLSGGLRLDGADISPIHINANLQGVFYEQMKPPFKIVADEAGMELSAELGTGARVGAKGSFHDLELCFPVDNSELNITAAKMVFEMDDKHLTAEASLKMDGNEIPMTYWHELDDFDEGWELMGILEVREAHLNTPWENGAILVKGMKGKSVRGKVSAKMSFSLGKEQAFQAALQARLSEGALALIDEEPFIEGIEADIKLESLVMNSTTDFHRVTARKATAFDVAMSDMALDYKLLENGDVSLRDMRFKAMGGDVLIDDFVLPAGDADYTFMMRFKKLDLELLADLFPSFSGRITGRVDGLLPIERSHGEICPRKGIMYLSPETKGKLRYDAGDSFSAGLDPKSEHYQRMKMVEQSLLNLDLKVLSVRLFDPSDEEKALVLRLEGHAPQVEGSPPIHLNVNGFKPDDEAVDFFDLLLRHRDRLDFGL